MTICEDDIFPRRGGDEFFRGPPPPLPPPSPSSPNLGLAGSVPFIVRLGFCDDGFVFLNLNLDLAGPSLPADAGDEEHVADDVHRPGVSGSLLSDEDRCGVAGVTCTLVCGCRSQCYLTGSGGGDRGGWW